MRIHDGAYGTLLAPRLVGGETADDLCVREPGTVVRAHRDYIDAGARAIQTNAFLAFQRGDRRRRDLHRAALACAREAVDQSMAEGGDEVIVFATLGPAGTEPSAYWDDMERLLELGARRFTCETVTESAVARAILEAWRDVARGLDDAELMLGCSIAPSTSADAASWVLELADEAPTEVVLGLNCCEGPAGLRPILEQLCELRGTSWVMPSAGIPRRASDGRWHWPLDTRAWSDETARLIDDLPLRAVGGCCGTTPGMVERLVALNFQ